MNKEFLKMQKAAGLITESEYKEKMDENTGEMTSLDQGTYMDFLNDLFNALGNGADAYSDNTWTEKEEALAGAIGQALTAAGIDLV